MPGTTFRLSRPEAQELRARVRSRVLRAGDVRRARLILMLSEGQSWSAIQQALGCSSAYIARWQARFAYQRLAGLFARHQGRPVSKRTPRLEARILAWTRRAPDDGSTHWSTRKLARALGINHMMVARVWRRAGLKPHRLERYMASDDPDFERKAADVIGLYLNPPQHAAVFCVDEKTAIQALDRMDPVLPLSPGRAERHGFEYYRHGTLSLYAALNTKTRRSAGPDRRPPHHRGVRGFLADVVAPQPRRREIHVIADNLSAHKTKQVAQFLAEHPKRSSALHADLFVVAQSGRTLVRQDRARCDRPRRLHLGHRPGAQAHALHPSLQPTRRAHQMDLPRLLAQNQPYFRFSCYRP